MEDRMTSIKDHDLLVRLDEKVDNLGKILSALVESLDQRGKDIEELKTHNLLHEKETKTQWERFDELNKKVSVLEIKAAKNEETISVVKEMSILLWVQNHPKASLILFIIFFLVLDFHDVLTPFILSMFGYKIPTP